MNAIDTRLCSRGRQGRRRKAVTISVHIRAKETRLVNVHNYSHGASILLRIVDSSKSSLHAKVGGYARRRLREICEAESAIPHRRSSVPTPACRRTGDELQRMDGREFHTKHNPHIETQTQWPRQVGRGAVLPVRARVRELYPRRVCAHMSMKCLHT